MPGQHLFPRPQPHAAARAQPAGAAGALVGVGLADTARHQTAAVAARVIAGAPLQTAVHHHGDAFDGDTGLRHIGGQHHPRPGRRFQHRRLGVAGQAPVQHLHRHRHRQPLAQPLDLAHPGQEHQHRALPGQSLHLAGAVIPDILIAARRRMAHLHREHPPLTAHRGQGQPFGQRAHVQRRRHHQQTQVLAQRLTDLLHQGQTQVRLQGTLVEFIEQNRRVALQRRVVTQHAGEHALGDHLDARRRAHPGVQPGAVAHGVPHRFTELPRHEPGHRPRRHPARLQHQNTVVAAPGRVQQRQRHAGGLAGAGRRLQHGAALLFQTTAQLRQRGVHRQRKISGVSHGDILSEMAFRAGGFSSWGRGSVFCPSGN